MGTAIGSIVLEERVASSAATELYRAHQPGLDRPVMVRKLRRDLLVRPALGEAFRREARLAARVRHPNVSGVIDLFAVAGDHYLVLDDAGGPSLRDALDLRGRPPRRVALAIARALARALDALHAAGVIHGDVSPEHVGIGRWGRVQLRDWGAARSVDESDAPPAPAGAYAAPEVLAGGRCGPAADVYAWATLAAELTTGAAPGDRPPSLLLRADPRLALLLRACLAADPANRPRAADVCARLERLLGMADSRAGTEVLAWSSGARPAAARAPAARPAAAPAGAAAAAARRLARARPAMVPVAAEQTPGGPAAGTGGVLEALAGRLHGAVERISGALCDLPRPGPGGLRAMAAGIAAGAIAVGGLELASRRAAPPAAPAQPGTAQLLFAEPAAVNAGIAPAEPSYLRVAAFPWAEVHVDGVRAFTTPRAAPLELPAGRHRVVLEHPRFGRVERSVRLAAGQQRTLRHVFDQTGPP